MTTAEQLSPPSPVVPPQRPPLRLVPPPPMSEPEPAPVEQGGETTIYPPPEWAAQQVTDEPPAARKPFVYAEPDPPYWTLERIGPLVIIGTPFAVVMWWGIRALWIQGTAWFGGIDSLERAGCFLSALAVLVALAAIRDLAVRLFGSNSASTGPAPRAAAVGGGGGCIRVAGQVKRSGCAVCARISKARAAGEPTNSATDRFVAKHEAGHMAGHEATGGYDIVGQLLGRNTGNGLTSSWGPGDPYSLMVGTRCGRMAVRSNSGAGPDMDKERRTLRSLPSGEREAMRRRVIRDSRAVLRRSAPKRRKWEREMLRTGEARA